MKALLIPSCLALALSACTTIAENGNDTSFQRVGPSSCPGAGALESELMIEVEGLPVRCGPQTQSVEG